MKKRTRSLAFSGTLTAMTVVALYLESIVPTGRAGFLVLTSFLLCVVYLECGMKWTITAYVASSILALFLVPDKIGLIPFFLLFGIYPMLKNLIERINKLWLEWVIKLVGFTVILLVSFQVFKGLVPEVLQEQKWKWGAILVLELGFVIYDWIFTKWIHFYFERIAKHVK